MTVIQVKSDVSAPRFRIATRASRLALWQAGHIAHLLRAADAICEVELVEIRSTGDRDQRQPLREFGGQGAFTSEIRAAVRDGRANLAVHSLKDLPTQPVDGLTLAAVPARGSVCDALVMPLSAGKLDSIADLPEHSRVGTGSPRRQSQLLHHRPDLKTLEIRGNVETRLRKLDDGDYDAVVLAVAGLTRLGLADRISLELPPGEFFPAVGQGALGIECRSDDPSIIEAILAIDDESTHRAVRTERTLLAELRGGCHAPVGAWSARKERGESLEAVVLSQDGRTRISAAGEGTFENPDTLGQLVARQLLKRGADKIVNQHGEGF